MHAPLATLDLWGGERVEMYAGQEYLQQTPNVPNALKKRIYLLFSQID